MYLSQVNGIKWMTADVKGSVSPLHSIKVVTSLSIRHWSLWNHDKWSLVAIKAVDITVQQQVAPAGLAQSIS